MEGDVAGETAGGHGEARNGEAEGGHGEVGVEAAARDVDRGADPAGRGQTAAELEGAAREGQLEAGGETSSAEVAAHLLAKHAEDHVVAADVRRTSLDVERAYDSAELDLAHDVAAG